MFTLGQLQELMDRYVHENGEMPEVIIMSRKSVDHYNSLLPGFRPGGIVISYFNGINITVRSSVGDKILVGKKELLEQENE